MIKRSYLILIFSLFVAIPCHWANDLSISAVSIVSIDQSNQFAEIEMDISWDNSWRDATNWDATWVFVKYRLTGATGPFEHATLNYVDGTNDGHTVPSGSVIRTSPDGKGVFIYRSANGSGNFSVSSLRLRWNYGVDGIANLNIVDIKVMGIEMVYVPQGAFYLGDGQTTAWELYANFEDGTTGNPFMVSGEGSITLGGGGAGSLGNNDRENQFANDNTDPDVFDCDSAGCLAESGDDFDDITSQTLPTAFPKGYDAFYCMKYEVTQEQLVDMLNCSTPTQQAVIANTSHFWSPSGSNATVFAAERYGISESSGIYSTSEPYIPLIFLDWIRAAAYADWAALRPMTELEFEKSCRGMEVPVVNEFAWGNANVDLSDNLTLNNYAQANEGVASGYEANGTDGNCWVGAMSQVMPYVARVGIFAAHASNSGRVSSGASIWGIMELSGNAWERAVSVGDPEGRKFDGSHGDGNISASGYADEANWPGTLAGGLVNTNIGVGYRGGALVYPTPNLETNARVSSRRLASGYWNIVIKDDGARFVRTAN